MKKLLHALATLAVLALLALPALPAASEDLTIVSKTTGPDGDGTSTQYLSSERMRTSDGHGDLIFEYATGKMTQIDHKKKQYSETTLAELEAAMRAASGEMKKMAAQLEAMPPEMRKKMETMMGGGGEVVLTKGDTREIAGYATQEYTVTRGASMTMQLWTTTQISPPVSLAQIRRMTSFAGPMAAMAGNPMFKGMGELIEKMQEIEGFPLADANSFSLMGRSMQTSREATEVRTGPIPAATFDVAALTKGYKKGKSPVEKMGRR